MAPRPTVVIVDQWALMRLGLGTVARGADMRVVGDTERGADGLLAARSEVADLLIVGLVADMTPADLVREAGRLLPAPAVVVLVERPGRDELAELFTAGARGVIRRSSDGAEVADTIARVVAGERVIAPSLLPALAGMVDADDGPRDATAVAGDGPALTGRERDVLRALASGHTNKEIAERLYVTEATVKTHLTNLYAKLDARDRHDAVARAVALGVLE